MVLDGLDESREYPKNERCGVCQAPLRRPREHLAFGMYSKGPIEGPYLSKAEGRVFKLSSGNLIGLFTLFNGLKDWSFSCRFFPNERMKLFFSF